MHPEKSEMRVSNSQAVVQGLIENGLVWHYGTDGIRDAYW